MTETTSTVAYERADDGVVTLTINDPSQSVNTMNQAFADGFSAALDRLESEIDDVTGVVVTSGKSTFFAGGDLRLIIQATPDDAQSVFDESQKLKAMLRRLESCGKPVAAALNGAALGGGLEIALACHRRFATDAKGAKFGLPEVSLGLLPGAGGVVRITRMLGVMDGMLNVLGQGQQHPAVTALEVGIIDEIVAADDLVATATQWVRDNPEHTTQPWQAQGFRVPGGTVNAGGLKQMLPALPASLRKQLKGTNMPAPIAILSVAVEGLNTDLNTAYTIESRYFAELATGQISKNMSKAFFFDLQHINGGGSRPDGHEAWRPTKVAVLGAGMMGAGIAYVLAKSGVEVVLKDVSIENANRGKAYSETIVEKGVSRGKTTQEKGDALLALITPTDDYADCAGADCVIEAVFESVELKHTVFGDIQKVVAPDALLCSNTSSLPITQLAEGVDRPADFVGLHFFSPVDKMPLVEIIRGEKTSDAALAKAYDVVQVLRKTPIVVNDSRGFFTSRVIGTFLNEALEMLHEGVSPVTIDRAATLAGYPVGPLQLLDELTLTLPQKLRKESQAAAEAAGEEWVVTPAQVIGDRMVDEFNRPGKFAGGAFYDYDENGKRTGLWPGLFEHFAKEGVDVSLDDVKERMLFAEALETVKTFDEGVITSVPDANIGSIFGIGFPAWTGGVAQYIDQYPGGVTGFVARAKELADRYGDRFDPPASLKQKAENGELFSGNWLAEL